MKALSNLELTTFCGQLALILRSGISSLEGLTIMLEDAPKGEGRQLLEGIVAEMETTGSLYMALESAQGAFPPYLIHMVELGETSGRLDDVMNSLAEHYRREDYLAKSIKSAVTYPLIMLGMMVAVMLVLIIRVLPVFNQVFEQLGTSLTGVSGVILGLGDTLSRYSVALVAVALAVAALFLYFFYSQKGRARLASFANTFALTRSLSEKIACARFASGMYLSLSSGLDVDQSLEMVARLVEHPTVSAKVKRIQERLMEGESFSDAVDETGIFSGVYARMIHIGGKTGAMDDIMKQISAQYDEEIEERMAGMVSKLEPTLVAILSVAVGMVLLSVMLPLMGIMSNIG